VSRLVAIHQPNFLPWLGFFAKLARADVFVLLDDAQFQKKGGTWTNRVKLLVSGEPTWVTVPVDRGYHGVRSIAEMRIGPERRWRDKLTRTIAQAYARAPGYEQTMPAVERVLEQPTDRLVELNESGIRALAGLLDLDESKLVRSSTLGVESTATERLVELTRAVGGDVYLSGDGAAGYQEDELFAEAGIQLRKLRFSHPRYPQPGGRHVPGLSAVDALMSCGPAGAAALLAQD
jgi:hypothetical protein